MALVAYRLLLRFERRTCLGLNIKHARSNAVVCDTNQKTGSVVIEHVKGKKSPFNALFRDKEVNLYYLCRGVANTTSLFFII